jgi:methyl-accepting chemotaxis protein
VTVRDWAIVAAALFWGVLVLSLSVLVFRVVKVLDEVIGTVGRVTDESVPILRGVNDTVAGVNVELARVDTIVAGVQSITATTDNLASVVHASVSNPLIKAAAFASGTARAARVLRG